MPTAKKRSSGPAARAARALRGARATKPSKPTKPTKVTGAVKPARPVKAAKAAKAAKPAQAAKPARSVRGTSSDGTTRAGAKRRAAAPARKRAPVSYDCGRCPAYCCSIYERVEVTKSDLVRLAAHLGLTIDETKRKHTKLFGRERVLRRRKDHLLPTACKFLDPETRGCTIYEGRPEVCRDYPGQKTCGYFDVIEFERRTQNDKHVLPVIQVTFPSR
jgi:Fe-S-cluster containining protein